MKRLLAAIAAAASLAAGAQGVWPVTSSLVVGSTAIATASSTGLTVSQGLILTVPVTETAAARTVLSTDNFIIADRATTVTLTLGTATAGKMVWVRTIQAATVVSASANVVPRAGGAAATAILAATDGAWALLVGDGTNWQLMAGTP
jgi:hypothetical protein